MILDQEDVGAVILDSISTLLVYESPQVVTKFLHMIITKASLKGCHGAFIFLKEDTSNHIIHDLSMLVDVVRDYTKDGLEEKKMQPPPPESDHQENANHPGFIGRLLGKHSQEKKED